MGIRIVQTVTATNMAELCAKRDAAVDADIVELRLDGVEGLDVAAAVGDRTRPVIVTCRPSWEGGRWTGDELARRGIMRQAVEHGADFVDIERKAGWVPDLRGTATRLVVSDHDFHGIPSDVPARLRDMRALGAHIVKIAAKTDRIGDVFRLSDFASGGRPVEDLVVIAMGPAGQVTRVLPGRFHSCWTYGGDGTLSHLGQTTVSWLRHRFRVDRVTESTRVFGVVGSPIAHSASPAMHNAAFEVSGIDAVHVPLLAQTVPEAFDAAKRLGVVGLSVTAPLKRGWTDMPGVVLDDEASNALGVVNTLKWDGSEIRARNFDVDACIGVLTTRGVELSGTRVLVLGAGGAARAAAWGLARAGALVAVSARRAEEAAVVARDLGVDAVEWPPTGEWRVVVNATPVGTSPSVDDSPVTWGALRAAVAYDLVYNPEDTTFLRMARDTGAETIGGLDMLVAQAARQFAWWTGTEPEAAVMREAARAFIRETTHS